jgi:DNA-binding MarR family transcriptional regulator
MGVRVKRSLEVGSAELPVVELDDLLQHRARIGAAVLLARHDQLSFSRLKALLEETDGNLGAQMRKLEDAGYVKAIKEFQDRRPVTWYALTPKGKRALEAHLANLERLIKQARGAPQ